jgi:DNA end-binding protein Ku
MKKNATKTKKAAPLKPAAKEGRAIWKGTLSVGLVSVPVAVFSAVRESKFSFNQFRQGDLSPIRYKKVAEADGKEVPADQIVKGLRQGDKVIVLTENEMASVNLKSLKVIDVDAFVAASEIDGRMLEKPYFLEAINGGLKGYSVLYETMVASDKVGVAKIALRNREYLAVVRPNTKHRLLQLDVLYFADELVEPTITKADAAVVSEPELKLGLQLVKAMSKPFRIEAYSNTYNDALGQLLAEKAAGTLKIAETKAAVNQPVPDMLEILRAAVGNAAA